MAEQSHRDEMNAAIRAQRERQAVARTIAPIDDEAPVEAAALPAPEPVAEPAQTAVTPPPRKSMFDRLRGR